jgi:hypothetical protein
MTEPASAEELEAQANVWANRAQTEAAADYPKAATYASIANAFAQLAMSKRLGLLLESLAK